MGGRDEMWEEVVVIIKNVKIKYKWSSGECETIGGECIISQRVGSSYNKQS